MGEQTRNERVARNESTFRDANEKLRDLFEREYEDEPRLPFLCECADPRCTKVVMLSLDEYAHVREHPARFLTLHGHEEPDTETVVDVEGRYQVVQKRGQAAAVARSLAPRRPSAA